MEKTMQERIESIRKQIGYPTILRFFELENYIITDFVTRGVAYIIKNHMNLTHLDSTGLSFTQLHDVKIEDRYSLKIQISKRMEKTSDVKEYVDDGEYEIIKLLSQEIPTFSSNVIYLKIKK